MPVSPESTVEISHKGSIQSHVLEAAVEKVTHVAERSREHVDHIEVRLTLEPDPARSRPAMAESTINVQGTPIRAHLAAGTVDEAVDLLVERLRRRLARHEDRRHRQPSRHRTGDSGPGEWRHGDLPSARPEHLHVDFDEREVRRHKTFAMYPISVEEAEFDLYQLGHDFYLFVDQETGEDSLIQRADDSEVQLDSSARLPELSLAQAKEHLELTGNRLVFYRSSNSARGHVLYHRFDGHYGLLTPA